MACVNCRTQPDRGSQKTSVRTVKRGNRKIIKVVSDKIFTGYKIESVLINANTIKVSLKPDKQLPEWKIEIQPPNIQNPPLEWFKSDIASLEAPILDLIKELPVDSLSWCDSGLRDEIVLILAPVLPGWRPSLVVHAKEENMLPRRFLYT